MIGRLKGVLIEKKAPRLLLDVQGVGYEVEAPMTTFYQLPEVGNETCLLTHLIVREDAHLLYGFSTKGERSLFRTLIRINGVGAKLALTILSGMSVKDLTEAVNNKDVASLVRLPGVGKKTAERLLIELRDKLKGLAETFEEGGASVAISVIATDPVTDALSALVALGYKESEASKMVRAINRESLSSEEIIRHALQASAKVSA